MINLLAGAAIVGLIYLGIKSFAAADPRKLARLARGAGGALLLVVAGFLGIRGELFVALPLALFALSLIGWNVGTLPNWARARRLTGSVSRVRTAYLDMELDHDSGRLSGKLIGGAHNGVALDTLDIASLARLAVTMDAESRQLLEAYLDRRAPGWREHRDGDAGGRNPRAAQSSAMTEEEAYQILGLEPGARADQIGEAHRRLMKKLHPDQGGSNYLAARVNNAKETLMRRHR